MCSAQSPKCGFSKIIILVVSLCAAVAIAAPAQTLTTLANFSGANGSSPTSQVTQGNDGNFYGTTLFGGTNNGCSSQGNGCGTVYKLTPSGTLTTLYSFCSLPNCADGFYPNAGLVQGTDGSLYGTTNYSGSSGVGGTFFRITLGGTLTTLYTFCSQANCADGELPNGGVIEGNDGNFYGTTERGGSGAFCPSQYTYGCGTVFKLTPSGTLTTLYNFYSQANGADGYFPEAGLIQGVDGSFYGSTEIGGTSCSGTNPTCGTLFKITASGTFTSLYSFSGVNGASSPQAALVQGVDGNFYGTTEGATGAVFSITPSGTLTVLHVFDGLDGGPPQSALVQADDGNFYGTTTSYGGGNSTIFKITPSGTLMTLYTFSGPDGIQPLAGVIQAIDGNLYGTTYSGGANNDGTVFRFTGPTAAPAQFVPTTPCRLIDTRSGSPVPGGTWAVFDVPQLYSMNANCTTTLPSTALAYSLNVTVVPRGTLGYLTIWPAGRPQPNVSTLNSTDGRTKANAAIIPVGAADAVSVYVTNTTDVILDIDGYFAPAISQTLQFFPLTPCRVVDTRAGSGLSGGLGPPSFGAMETRPLPILSSSCFQNLPNQPQAYSFNVTVVPHPPGQPLNFLTIWPYNQPLPVVSTLNNPTGTVVANAAIVPADPATGMVDVYTFNSTDVIIDTNGYFATPGGYSYYPTAPCRALDTRTNNGPPFTGELTVPIQTSPCAPPSNAIGYVFNATVVPRGSLGYLTLWPDQMPQQPPPIVSTLNAYDGYTTSNLAIVPNIDGSTDALAGQGYTQLILDISGYFAP